MTCEWKGGSERRLRGCFYTTDVYTVMRLDDFGQIILLRLLVHPFSLSCINLSRARDALNVKY